MDIHHTRACEYQKTKVDLILFSKVGSLGAYIRLIIENYMLRGLIHKEIKYKSKVKFVCYDFKIIYITLEYFYLYTFSMTARVVINLFFGQNFTLNR